MALRLVLVALDAADAGEPLAASTGGRLPGVRGEPDSVLFLDLAGYPDLSFGFALAARTASASFLVMKAGAARPLPLPLDERANLLGEAFLAVAVFGVRGGLPVGVLGIVRDIRQQV